LAEQTYNEINNFKKYLDAPVIRTMLVVGGIPIKEQLSDLQKGVIFCLIVLKNISRGLY
jgi:ATP-dependent RNA helicase DDX1